MQKAYKYLIAGLAIGLIVAAVGTYAITAGQGQANELDCDECHAEGHGSVIAPDINVNGTILLTGDSPKDEYVIVDGIFALPQREIITLESQNASVASRGVPVLDFLKAHGVSNFDALVIYADDFVLELKRADVTEDTIFVPKEFSLRILGSNMPVSTWLEGIRTIDVVGGPAGDSITVNGQEVTFGQMLEGGIQTMPVSERTIGYIYRDSNYAYDTAFMVTGISLKDLLFKQGLTDFNSVTIDGVSLSRNGVLTGSYFLTRNDGVIVLATADKNRPNWPEVKSITVA
ncbi:MAG: hypothetical protein A4E28_01350 [Methanocella sp. PtaU1.Bin125]|nr:MAG: hypothetical protein A4E28_01350 [Methanocella sp. PtaU1.Bin125]